MELKDLKSDWQNAGKASKSEGDLLNMTRISNHPTLKRIRIKLFVETILLLLFSVVYYDWFDGDKKPFYANFLLVSSLMLYITNDVIGYISVIKPVNGLNIKISIENYLASIQRLSVFSLLVSLLYSISLTVFFTSVIHFTREKSFLLLGLIIILSQLLLWSHRVWVNRIKKLQLAIKDFDPAGEE